jgi:hypothetical protein
MGSAVSSFPLSASRRSTSSSPHCIWLKGDPSLRAARQSGFCSSPGLDCFASLAMTELMEIENA